MKKEQLIKKIQNLSFGDIIVAYDDKGNFININDYDEETDCFNVYGDDMICHQVKFENLNHYQKFVTC